MISYIIKIYLSALLSICSLLELPHRQALPSFLHHLAKIKTHLHNKKQTNKKPASFISLVHREVIRADFSLWISIFKKHHYNQLATLKLYPYMFPLQWNKRQLPPSWKMGHWFIADITESHQASLPMLYFFF